MVTPSSANAASGCEFGKKKYWDRNGVEITNFEDLICEPIRIEAYEWKDEFDKYLYFNLDNDYPELGWELSDSDTYIQRSLFVFCDKKKLSVHLGAEYPDTYGYTGYGKYKVDNKKAVTFKYTVSSPFDTVFISNPKGFLKAFVTAKSKVSFQINTLMGTEITSFAVTSLKNVRAVYKSYGCKF